MEEDTRNSELTNCKVESLQGGTDAASTETNNQQICSLCKRMEADEKFFKSQPCGCSIFCKKCAMKIATGGKCKICKSMFVSVVGVTY